MKILVCLRLPGAFFACGLFFILAFYLPLAMAQNPPAKAASEAALLNPLAPLEQVQGLDEAQKNKLLGLSRQTKESLQAAETYKDRARAYRQSIESAPAQIKKIDEQLAYPDTSEVLTNIRQAADKASLSELEQRLTREEAELAALENTLVDLDRQLQEQQNRPRQARDELTEAKQQKKHIEKDLKELPPPEAALPLTEARRTALQARLEARLNEIHMLEQELLSYSVRLQLLTAQRDLAARQISQAQAETGLLQRLINQRRQIEAGEVQEATARAEEESIGKHPAIRQLAEENARLSKELASLVARLDRISVEHEEAEAQLNQIEQDFKITQQRLEIAGLNEVLQQILQDQRWNLPNPNRYQTEVEQHREEMAEVGLNQLRIDERRRHLGKLNQAVAQVMAEQVDPGLPKKQREGIESEIRQLLQDQKNLLDKLYVTQTHYLRELESLTFSQRQLLETVKQYTAFLDEHLLWIPSASPLGLKTLYDLAAGIDWLLSMEGWLETARTLKAAAMDKPLLVILVVLLFIGLLQVRRNLPQTLETTAERVSMPYADRFSFTLRALAVTLLAAAPWPLLLGAGGWLLRATIESSDFVKAVDAGLTAVALPLLLMHGFQLLCRPQGVAEVHFGWHPQVLAVWQRNMHWAIPTLVPALFVTAMTGAQVKEGYTESLGQLSFMVSMVALALLFQRVLRPKGGIFEHHLTEQPTSWLSRFRYIWYSVAVGLPVILAGLAAAGYYYTALHLKNEIIATLRLATAAVLVHDLAVRWLVVAQRKLALLKMREKREVERATQSTREAASRSGVGVPAKLDIHQLDIQTVNEHTRKLLHTVIGLWIVVGLWLIWAPAFPALGIFNEVTLWYQTVVTEGQEVQKPFTLGNLMMVFALTLLAFGAARNLPGVLEIVVLRRLSLVPGSRYAITTLARYAIGITGIILVVEVIGGSWSQIQWLVAALTVGLGFGLQEIFANFVSGLIILFERPVRVGDVVTVGDVSGTVSRIRIRATTITDFDNKELIIPNKAFVTDRIINWTLSDSITRVTVKVGVAYSSDTQLVHQIILDVVKKNPLVLAKPEPSVYFAGFGENSLDFVVWAFVKELGDRIPLTHDLNTAINRALREQGIEIPLPQRAIHVRSTAAMAALKEWGSQSASGQDPVQSPQETSEVLSEADSPKT